MVHYGHRELPSLFPSPSPSAHINIVKTDLITKNNILRAQKAALLDAAEYVLSTLLQCGNGNGVTIELRGTAICMNKLNAAIDLCGVDPITRQPSIPKTHKTMNDETTMYLDYVNNFLTVDSFAAYYLMDREEALNVIKRGRIAHEASINLCEVDQNYRQH